MKRSGLLAGLLAVLVAALIGSAGGGPRGHFPDGRPHKESDGAEEVVLEMALSATAAGGAVGCRLGWPGAAAICLRGWRGMCSVPASCHLDCSGGAVAYSTSTTVVCLWIATNAVGGAA